MILDVFSHLKDYMMEASSKLSFEIYFYSGSLSAPSEGFPPTQLFTRHSELCCSFTSQQSEQRESSISLPWCICHGICSKAAHSSDYYGMPNVLCWGSTALFHTTLLRDGAPHTHLAPALTWHTLLKFMPCCVCVSLPIHYL